MNNGEAEKINVPVAVVSIAHEGVPYIEIIMTSEEETTAAHLEGTFPIKKRNGSEEYALIAEKLCICMKINGSVRKRRGNIFSIF